jgi:predicted ATP-grasp superfamily ATP-dependent carboligase
MSGGPRARRLVILGGTLTGLAVARDARRAGMRCRVFDIDGGAIRYSSAVDEYLSCASYDEALADLDKQDGEYWLIADSDHWLRFLVANRHRLGRAVVLHPVNEAIEVCLSKHRFARWCEQQGFFTPRVVRPGDADVRFPVVVRPDSTRHREFDTPKASVARDSAALEAAIRDFERVGAEYVVTEALIDEATRYYAVGFARRGDGELLAFATEKVRPPVDRCRGASYVETRAFPEAIELARRAAERLQFIGVGELEIAHRDGRCYLIELNPRPWLQYSMGRALGLSLIAFVALGETPRPPGGRASWISLKTDAYWCLSRRDGLLWSGELSWPRFVAQVLGASCHPLWDWRDPLPFLRTALGGR